jgi:hypothetical protein
VLPKLPNPDRCLAAAANSTQLRCFAAGQPPEIKPNPLQQIVPPIIKGFGAAVAGIKAGGSAVVDGLTNSAATRGSVAYFADKVGVTNTSANHTSYVCLCMCEWAIA